MEPPARIPRGRRSAHAPSWSIVLAAGDGARLAPLTRLLYGRPVPKQFATLRGGSSLLQLTLERSERLAPPERTIVVVPEAFAGTAEEQSREFGECTLLAQPRNAGTGPGILLPLAHLLRQSPDASVVVLPSDHHFARPDAFIGRLEQARAMLGQIRSGVCLVAVDAESPATDYGWIVPQDAAAARRGWSPIVRFVEKPDPALARALHAERAVWNTFVIVARAAALWRLAARWLPRQADLVRAASAMTSLREIYRRMPPANFSHEVLARASGIGVVTVANAGWTDLGTPERVFEILAGSADRDALLARCGLPPSPGAWHELAARMIAR